MKVLFIVPYPKGKAGSQRFRFEQYLHLLDQQGIQYQFSSFWDKRAWDVLYKQGNVMSKIFALFRGLMRRYFLLFTAWRYDVFFIHREVYPVGIPYIEWFLTKIVRRKVIYDFDDAIWIPNFAQNNKSFAFLKSYGHVKYLCKNASVLSVGNDYLVHFSKQHNPNVVLNPTTIDTENYHNRVKDQNTESVVVGWTGTHSTIRYLEDFLSVFKKVYEQQPFKLVVISDKDPKFDFPDFEFRPWSKETEIEDLLRFNVGVMPLTDDKWAKGKCGFKALQYMSLGIPAIVSPVGVNTKIVDHGENGYVCDTEEEWEKALLDVLTDQSKLVHVANNSRKKIIDHYSVLSNSETFINLFKS